MQVLIAIPDTSSSASNRSAAHVLMRSVCGVSLLIRTVALAARSRTDEVLIVWPQSVAVELAEECMSSDLLREQVNVRLMRVKSFDPLVGSSWISLRTVLFGCLGIG
jgi:hypothetical protein